MKTIPVKVRVASLAAVATMIGFILFWTGTDMHLAQAQEPLSIPKAWGSVKGTIAGFLVLEDSAGVIRLVGSSTGKLDRTIIRN